MTTLIDTLKDIVSHTRLSSVTKLKVAVEDNETRLLSMADDRSLYIIGTATNPDPQIKGTFGIPNLSRLGGVLGFDDYSSDLQAKVTYTDDKLDVASITLHTPDKTLSNEFRMMSRTIVNDQVRTPVVKAVKWDVEFTPSEQTISRLRFQTGVHDSPLFTVEIVGDNLVLNFGDSAVNSGTMVMATGMTGKTLGKIGWSARIFNEILSTGGDKTISLSSAGAAKITVKSGISTWDYVIPAQSR
jgi:hypothetical protein